MEEQNIIPSVDFSVPSTRKESLHGKTVKSAKVFRKGPTSHSLSYPQHNINSLDIISKVFAFLLQWSNEANKKQAIFTSLQELETDLDKQINSERLSKTLQMISKQTISSRKCSDKPLKYVFLGDDSNQKSQVSVQIIHTHNSLVLSKQNMQPAQSSLDRMDLHFEEYQKATMPDANLESLPQQEEEEKEEIEEEKDESSRKILAPAKVNQYSLSQPKECEFRRSSIKKVSLVVWDDIDNGSHSSQIFSETSSEKQISIGDLPELPLNEEIIAKLFDTPSPFLINLVMALFLKQALATRDNPPPPTATIALLALSTMVAYKISYDESMQGMIEYYSSLLRISEGELIKLQRWFLGTLNYEVTVSGRYYYEVMRRIMMHP